MCLCQKLGCDYQKVQKGVLLSGYINDMHTYVPGPDGKLGYGGKCFPKDVKALVAALKDTALSQLLQVVDSLNEQFRKE